LSMRVGLLVVLLGFFFPCAHTQGQLIRVNSAYTGESPTQLVAFLAKETGIFAKNGLDVQVIRTTSSIAVMGLLSGEMAILQIALQRSSARTCAGPMQFMSPRGS